MTTKSKLLTELLQFQAEMTSKMMEKFDEGYEWWDNPTELPNEELIKQAHSNPDPIDRANYNFFIWYREKE